MAHVAAVGQVVGAVHAGKQLEHIAGFERGAAAGVVHDLVWVGLHVPQLAPYFGERVGPGDGLVFIGGRVVAHGLRQAPGFLQVVIQPGFEFA